MQTFDLAEMAKLSGTKPATAKNWTVGRPFTIPASVHQAPGRGSINLYSIDDVYLMAMANQLSEAGMTARAIGDVVSEIPAGELAQAKILTIWKGAKGKVYVLPGDDRPPGVIVCHVVDVARLVQGINQKLTGKK